MKKDSERQNQIFKNKHSCTEFKFNKLKEAEKNELLITLNRELEKQNADLEKLLKEKEEKIQIIQA